MRHWSDPLIVFKALYRYTCRAIPSKIPNATVKRCAFVAKSLLHPRLSTAWFSLLSKVPLRDLVELDPSLCRRLRPPYLCADWSSREILAILKQHYEWAVHCLPPSMFQALYLRNELLLATWTTKRRYVVYLRHCGKSRSYRKEGELVIDLECLDEPGELTSMIGTVALDPEGRRCFYIGGVQGALKHLGATSIKQAMREMHDLRPKSLVFFVAQTLACAWGCQRILAVTETSHAYGIHKKRKFQKGDEIHFDYNAAWIEVGGTAASANFYELPLVTPCRSREQMKPNHRPKYARRYAMMDDIVAQITAHFAVPDEFE